jgi:hypothetical protein
VTVEYLVLGVILILMGAGQIYLRHFSGGDDAQAAARRQGASRRGVRSGRVWESWTAILGFLGLAMGVGLLVLGVLGR